MKKLLPEEMEEKIFFYRIAIEKERQPLAEERLIKMNVWRIYAEEADWNHLRCKYFNLLMDYFQVFSYVLRMIGENEETFYLSYLEDFLEDIKKGERILFDINTVIEYGSRSIIEEVIKNIDISKDVYSDTVFRGFIIKNYGFSNSLTTDRRNFYSLYYDMIEKFGLDCCSIQGMSSKEYLSCDMNVENAIKVTEEALKIFERIIYTNLEH